MNGITVTVFIVDIQYLGDLDLEVGERERSEGEWDLAEGECERDEERERELRVLRDEDLPLLELLEYLICAGDVAVTPL